MKTNKFNLLLIALLFISSKSLSAEVFFVDSQTTFIIAHADAGANDSIIWEPGTYSDIYMNITKNLLYIGAKNWGGTVFNGASRVKITGDYITLEGFQWVGGNIGSDDIINSYGSYNHFNQLNLKDYTCYKYLRIREEGRYNVVSYCNFENRINLDDQNILSILVDDTNPGYHKVQYCSFKNFDGSGNDLGIEPIRIGVSTQADFISRSLVEYCYFTQCNGDGEIISSKATQNVYRFNTFEDNPLAELVLRHGSEAIVYGNFFLNGKGGVRVREGQDHYIYNNYFFGIDDRPIFLQNESSDPLDNINIAFNTVLNCAELPLGGSGSFKPTNVTFANNIFWDPQEDVFEDATGNETWIGNISNNFLGITFPSSGISLDNPLLEANSEGYFGLTAGSPAIDAAKAGYALLPQFEGMDPVDVDISFDLMGQSRPSNIEDKDLGCNEFPHNTLIRPFVTEENTGPDYETDFISSVDEELRFIKNIMHFSPNPANHQIAITLQNEFKANVVIDILDTSGRKLGAIYQGNNGPGEVVFTQELGNLSSGIYLIRATQRNIQTGKVHIQTLKLIKQ